MILGIETTSPVTSVALARDGDVVAAETSSEPRGHVEFLMPAIQRIVGEHGLGALTGMAVGIGPGLFTSMRVGIATAKTLAVTLEVPLVAVCSLDALAHPFAAEAAAVCACVDARRGEVFAGVYADGRRIEEPRAWDPAALAEHLPAGTLLIGDGPEAYHDALGGLAARSAFPTAEAVLALGMPRLAAGDADDALALEPLYVRASDAEIKWEQRGVVIERPMRVKTRGR